MSFILAVRPVAVPAGSILEMKYNYERRVTILLRDVMFNSRLLEAFLKVLIPVIVFGAFEEFLPSVAL